MGESGIRLTPQTRFGKSKQPPSRQSSSNNFNFFFGPSGRGKTSQGIQQGNSCGFLIVAFAGRFYSHHRYQNRLTNHATQPNRANRRNRQNEKSATSFVRPIHLSWLVNPIKTGRAWMRRSELSAHRPGKTIPNSAPTFPNRIDLLGQHRF